MNWNGFFDVSELDGENLKQLFREALTKSISSHVDTLKYFKRERHESMTPEEYIETILSPTTHNVVIDRVQYSPAWDKVGEVVSTTLDGESLYLFIFLDLSDFYNLIVDFGLKKKLF